VEYMGHVVSQGEVRADPPKVESIVKWPRPKTVKEVERLL